MNRALLRAASALPRTRAVAPVPARGLKKNARIEEWNGMREDLQKSFQVDSSNSFGLFASIIGLPILIYMYTKLDLVRARPLGRALGARRSGHPSYRPHPAAWPPPARSAPCVQEARDKADGTRTETL